MIPTKETIIEAGAIIQAWIEDLERRQDLPQNRGPDKPRLFAKTAMMARRELLGSGCVVGWFDERYLDDNFGTAVNSVMSGMEEP